MRTVIGASSGRTLSRALARIRASRWAGWAIRDPRGWPLILVVFMACTSLDPSTSDAGGTVATGGKQDSGAGIETTDEAGSEIDPGALDGGTDASPGDAGAVATTDGTIGPGQLGCAAGSELSLTGACVDIDECARVVDDCDHEPQACINAAPGFSCACPSGYRGTGRGASGCVDIDECAERTASCDALAPCNNRPGSYACGSCPPGYGPGDAGTCADLNECMTNNGGCDTSPMATCNNQVGAANTCSCPSGYAGNGVGTNGCTDPCVTNPCAAGLTCTRSPSATAICSATCAASVTGCQLGDTCVNDTDCRSGGDSNATCDATDKVCVTVCATTSIVSQANLDAARYCREINGDLIVNPNFATIAASALPYLTRLRGRFNADPSGVPNTSAQSLTFGNLQTIDGDLSFGLFQGATLLSFPRLASVGGKVGILLVPALQHLALPQLASVQGNFQLSNMPISQLDVGRLQTVGGTLTIGGLCKLPWSQVSRISALGTTQSISDIGCCTGQTTQHACSGACSCN